MSALRELIYEVAIDLAQSSSGVTADIGDALLFLLANDWAMRLAAAIFCVFAFYAVLVAITRPRASAVRVDARQRENEKLRIRGA